MTEEARLAYVILAVGDLTRAVEFYERAFGFERRVDTPVFCELDVPGGPALGLYLAGAFAANTGSPARLPAVPGETGPAELYFVVDDLDGAQRRLLAAGATRSSEALPRDWGDDAAYFADPDGHVVVVARPSRYPPR